MDNQQIPNDDQQMQPSKEDIKKQQAKDAISNVGKEIGKKALEAHGVPPGLSDLAANKIANNPFVQSNLNKVANNSLVKNALGDKGLSSGGLPPLKSPMGGLPGLSSGGISNSADEDDGGALDTAQKMASTAMKIKKYWPIISAIAPVVGWILLAIIGIILIMIPIMFIQENIEKFEEGIDKFINFISGQGWETSEVVFFQTLKNEYDRFHNRLEYIEGEFDIPLIAATVHFNRIVDPDAYSYNGENIEYDDSNYNDSNPVIPANQLRNFYVKANNELGSAWTLVPGQKKLIGHLIDTKISYKCVAYPSGWSFFNFDAWEEFYAIIKTQLDDFWEHLNFTATDTTKDLIERKSVLRTIRLIYIYAFEGGSDYFENELTNLLYEIANDNIYKNIVEIIKTIEKPEKECGDKSIAVPILKKFINYEEYKKYLKTYLPLQPYARCENCEYKNASSERKEQLLNQWIEEIFDQRDAYNYLRGTPSKNQIMYVPGMASLPVQIGAGEDWKDYISGAKSGTPRGYGDPRCYKNGELDSYNCFHKGVDFSFAWGTPVVAIANGDVIMAVSSNEGYGNFVKLGHDLNNDGKYEYYSLYAHLSEINVSIGTKIGGGQQLGKVGSTGNSTGPHLHFEIRDSDDNPIDPAPILNGIQEGGSHPLSDFMACRMYTDSQIAAINNNLANAVNKAGYGTREGVVAAAKYLASELDVTVPYWYGGKYKQKGINKEWGCDKTITANPGTERQPTGSIHPYGLDCSGFVSWAIRNGGYKANTILEGTDNQINFTNEYVDWNDYNSINKVKPGDLAWTDGHIGIIVEVDKASCSYYVAEAKGAKYGVLITRNSCFGSDFKTIILMDGYYNNNNNKEA